MGHSPGGGPEIQPGQAEASLSYFQAISDTVNSRTHLSLLQTKTHFVAVKDIFKQERVEENFRRQGERDVIALTKRQVHAQKQDGSRLSWAAPAMPITHSARATQKDFLTAASKVTKP